MDASRSDRLANFLDSRNATKFRVFFFNDPELRNLVDKSTLIMAPDDETFDRLSSSVNGSQQSISAILKNHISILPINKDKYPVLTAVNGFRFGNTINDLKHFEIVIANKNVDPGLVVFVVKKFVGGSTSNPRVLEPATPYIVQGPYALEKLHSKTTGQTVYLFYDYHAAPKCPAPSVPMTKFFDDLLRHPRNYTIDVMLEIAFNQTEGLTRDIPLNGLRNMLKSCYNVDKSKCPYPNTRIHWSDVRLSLFLKPYMDIYRIAIEALNTTPEVFRNFNIDAIDVDQKILSKFRELEARYDLDRMLDGTKIIKQIANIRDPMIRDRALFYITNKIRWAHDKFVQLLDRPYKNRIDLKLITSLLVFTAIFMDAYTTARMLRNFGDYRASRIIVYAGGNHSRNISDILQNVGFHQVLYIGREHNTAVGDAPSEPSFQCLDISAALPFFR